MNNKNKLKNLMAFAYGDEIVPKIQDIIWLIDKCSPDIKLTEAIDKLKELKKIFENE